jgi:hypothetical protein
MYEGYRPSVFDQSVPSAWQGFQSSVAPTLSAHHVENIVLEMPYVNHPAEGGWAFARVLDELRRFGFNIWWLCIRPSDLDESNSLERVLVVGTLRSCGLYLPSYEPSTTKRTYLQGKEEGPVYYRSILNWLSANEKYERIFARRINKWHIEKKLATLEKRRAITRADDWVRKRIEYKKAL